MSQRCNSVNAVKDVGVKDGVTLKLKLDKSTMKPSSSQPVGSSHIGADRSSELNHRAFLSALPGFGVAFGNMGNQQGTTRVNPVLTTKPQRNSTGAIPWHVGRGRHHQTMGRSYIPTLSDTACHTDGPVMTPQLEVTENQQTKRGVSSSQKHELDENHEKSEAKKARAETDVPGSMEEMNIKDILLSNAKVLANIQSRMEELNTMSKMMDSRVAKLEAGREEDKETINGLVEHCAENRESLNFLHEMLTDSNAKITEQEKTTGEKLLTVQQNHSNLLDTVQKVSQDV